MVRRTLVKIEVGQTDELMEKIHGKLRRGRKIQAKGEDRQIHKEKETPKENPKEVEKIRDPDRKIPKKQRREDNQEESRTPYQPGGRQGETPNKTPTKDRDANSLTPGGEGKTNKRDSRFGLCNGCGIEHPNPRVMTPKGFDHSGCRYYEKNHPDYNYANVTWADSPQGKIYATCGKKTLAPMLMIHNGIVVSKGNGLPFNKRPASDAGMTKPHTLKTYILPGTSSYRNGDAISARIQLDTGNQGRTLIRRDKDVSLTVCRNTLIDFGVGSSDAE